MDTLSTGNFDICKVPTCDKEARALGVCLLHRYRMENGLPLEVGQIGKRPISTRRCSLCDREHYAKDLCRFHYERNRKGHLNLTRQLNSPDPSSVKPPASKPTCYGPECVRVSEARGLCHSHLQQEYNGRELTVLRTSEYLLSEKGRVCKLCREDKPLTEYYLRSSRKATQNECKMCMKARSSVRIYESGKTQGRPTWAYDHLDWARSQNKLKGDKLEV